MIVGRLYYFDPPTILNLGATKYFMIPRFIWWYLSAYQFCSVPLLFRRGEVINLSYLYKTFIV